MHQVMLVDGMAQFVPINHVQLHQPPVIMILMLNAEPIYLDALLLQLDKDALQ
jgi:hypothetical protein